MKKFIKIIIYISVTFIVLFIVLFLPYFIGHFLMRDDVILPIHIIGSWFLGVLTLGSFAMFLFVPIALIFAITAISNKLYKENAVLFDKLNKMYSEYKKEQEYKKEKSK